MLVRVVGRKAWYCSHTCRYDRLGRTWTPSSSSKAANEVEVAFCWAGAKAAAEAMREARMAVFMLECFVYKVFKNKFVVDQRSWENTSQTQERFAFNRGLPTGRLNSVHLNSHHKLQQNFFHSRTRACRLYCSCFQLVIEFNQKRIPYCVWRRNSILRNHPIKIPYFKDSFNEECNATRPTRSKCCFVHDWWKLDPHLDWSLRLKYIFDWFDSPSWLIRSLEAKPISNAEMEMYLWLLHYYTI